MNAQQRKMQRLTIRDIKYQISRVHKYPMSRLKFLRYIWYVIESDYMRSSKQLFDKIFEEQKKIKNGIH